MIAALYVQTDGTYFNLPDVDPWDEPRDARKYDGPWPVIAHPPCQRWGRYWSGGPTARVRRELGDDQGCFEAALGAIRRFGGVIEHPEASHAWRKFYLPIPDIRGYWQRGVCGGWSCCVEQGHYGHRARKKTWLYYFSLIGAAPPNLKWGRSQARARIDTGYHSAEERKRGRRPGSYVAADLPYLSARERAATPPEFANLLIELARGAGGGGLGLLVSPVNNAIKGKVEGEPG